MIIYYRDRPLKLIPRKYDAIIGLTDHLEDFDHIRLSDNERQNLDMALFRQQAQSFIKSLADREPLVYEQIHSARPVMVHQVTTNDGQIYYSLKMSNGISVRCTRILFDLSPTKGRIKYAAQLSAQIAPQCVTAQLF